MTTPSQRGSDGEGDSALSELGPEVHAAALHAVGNAVVITDLRGRILWVNPAFTRLTGYSFEEIRGQNPRVLKSGAQDDEFYAGLWQTITQGKPWYGELKNRRKDGTHYIQDFMITPVRNAAGEMTHFIGVGQDITERKRMEEQLKHQATHDPLTGIPNRVLFEDRLERALLSCRRSGDAVALLFLDLDGFKEVNDSLGHLAGDKLLQTVAERLRRSVRDDDTVARIGGDEFVALLPGVGTSADAENVARKLLAAIQEPIELEGRSMRPNGSVGIAVSSLRTERADALRRRADAALYRAKERGGGNVCLAEEPLRE